MASSISFSSLLVTWQKLIAPELIAASIIEWCDNSFYMRELFRNYHLDKEMGVITETVYDHRGDRKQGVCKSNSTYFVEVVGNVHDNPELLNKEVAQNGG